MEERWYNQSNGKTVMELVSKKVIQYEKEILDWKWDDILEECNSMVYSSEEDGELLGVCYINVPDKSAEYLAALSNVANHHNCWVGSNDDELMILKVL